MFLYTLYIFVFCISVQSSLGYKFGNAADQNPLTDEHNEAASKNRITAPAAVQNEKVCDKAVTLQKILGVMISMLRQDVSKDTKTANILETLKDILRNTAGDNDEVMYKIEDLMHTLDKYKTSGENNDGKFLRIGLNNNSTRRIVNMSGKNSNPNQKIILKYELPALTNSYCTEALLSIIKIAYQAYISLEKNPICNLPEFPQLPGSNPQMPDFMKLVTPPKYQPGIWNAPSNINPYYLFPNTKDIFNPDNKEVTKNSVIEQPAQNNPIYEYLPNTYNIVPTDNSKFLPYSPQYPTDLFPNQPNNQFVYEYQRPHPTEPIENSPITINPYFPQSPDSLPLDYTLPNPRDPVYPYNPGVIPYPENNPLMPFPWPTKNPDFPFDKKSQSNPLNPYLPDTNYPQNIPNVPDFFPWGKRPEFPANINPQQLYPYGPNENNQEIVPEIPIHNKSKRPESFPFEINPAAINYLDPPNPYSNKYVFPPTLPSQPESLTPEYTSLVTYLPDDMNSQPAVFEFPYQLSESNHVSPYFPVDPPIQNPLNPNNPSDPYQPGLAPGFFPVESVIQNFTPFIPHNRPYPINTNIPNTNKPGLVDPKSPGIYDFNIYPDELRPSLLPSYPYIPIDNNPVYEFKLNPNGLSPNEAPIYPNIPIVQNPANGFELNPNEAPINPYIPNYGPHNWTPNIPLTVTPQDFNSFFSPIPATPPKIPQIPDFKIIGFIKNAIEVIEAMIPVVKFDPPTLSIIAKIKDIIYQKDKEIEVEEFYYIVELYKKLINYIKQLEIYKEIIDIIDLSRVTNRPELEPKNIVELTYLVKRPQPLVYHPYYYVKYRLPYPSFVVAAQNLLRQKPHLRMNPKELYEELLALSKVAETSPDLKSYKKEDILSLTFKSGSLVDTKLVGSNGALTEHLNVLRGITSDLTAEDILELNKEATNKTQLLAINPEIADNYQTGDKTHVLPRNVILRNNVEISNGEQEVQQQINRPIPQVLRMETPPNTDQNDPNTYPTTEANLGFSTFDSNKLRNDILRGQYVGMPNSNYVIPTNHSPLNGINESNSKMNQGTIYPKMYKLFDATLEARNSQRANQQNFLTSGGLLSLDNEIVSLNTGTDNRQESVNIVNPKIMINSPKSNPSLVNMDNTKTSLDPSNQQNLMNKINDQVNHHNLVNQHNAWTNQENYYNSGGLVNYDNQKISLNTGTGNRQDHVNFINSKVMLNKATDSFNFKSPDAPADQQKFMNLNSFIDGITRQDFANGDTTNTKFGVTSQQSLHNAVTNKETSNGSTTSHDHLVNFENDGIGFDSQKGIMNANDMVKQNVGKTPLNSETSNEQEKSNFIKKMVLEDILQYTDSDDSNVLNNTKDVNNQNLISFNNYQSPSHGETYIPTTSQDLTNHDMTTILLNTGNPNGQKLVFDTGMTDQQTMGSEQNFDTSMAGQQAITSQQNYDTSMAGQQTMASQQNFDTEIPDQQAMTSQQNLDTSMAGQQNFDTTMAGPQNFDTSMASQQHFVTGIADQPAMASQQNFGSGMAVQQAMTSQQDFDTTMAGQQNFDTTMASQQNFVTGIADQPAMASQQNFGSGMAVQQAMAIPQNFVPQVFGTNIGHSGHQLYTYVVHRTPIFFNQPTLQRFSLSTPIPFANPGFTHVTTNQFMRPITMMG